MDDFNEVHVVSDLHLGGTDGHQIFKGDDLLGELISSLAEGENRKVALVINGDFIDFLAEPTPTYFDPKGAAYKLERVSKDPGFKRTFEALKTFVTKKARELVIVLGNHDLELAMPRVQSKLLEILSSGSPEALGRVRLSVAGAGFAARVGAARVLCVHGNEADVFNITDYERLRREARDDQFGWSPKPWVPNPGTQLVIDVMNGIKRTRPFVDLLKPETDAVIPVLFALGEVDVERILGFLEVALKLSGTGVRKAMGLLSDAETEGPKSRDAGQRGVMGRVSPQTQAASELLSMVEQTFRLQPGAADDVTLQRLMDETEDRFRRGVDPLSVAPGEGEARLGLWNLTKAAVRWRISKLQGKNQPEALRAALQHVLKDKSFEPDHRDEDFKKLDELIPVGGADFLVAGHTHLERSHPRAGGHYINTGTWARLIKLDENALQNPENFMPHYEALKAKTMTELDDKHVVIHKPAVASIVNDKGVVRGVLNRVKKSGNKVTLSEVTSGETK